jgi:hypothetical protein
MNQTMQQLQRIYMATYLSPQSLGISGGRSRSVLELIVLKKVL